MQGTLARSLRFRGSCMRWSMCSSRTCWSSPTSTRHRIFRAKPLVEVFSRGTHRLSCCRLGVPLTRKLTRMSTPQALQRRAARAGCHGRAHGWHGAGGVWFVPSPPLYIRRCNRNLLYILAERLGIRFAAPEQRPEGGRRCEVRLSIACDM